VSDDTKARQEEVRNRMLNRIKLETLLSAMPISESLKIRTYIGEADFYFSLLKPDLHSIKKGSAVVEIGSGTGLLSMYIASLGYKVYSFEPQSSGFKDMLKIKELLKECWESDFPVVHFINDYYSESYFKENEVIDYFLAVNVIEHIPNYGELIQNVKKKMNSNSIFRIICPNYLIPYEPHFDIPIFFNKKSTFFLLRNKILNSDLSDPLEFWDDLSWPTPPKVKAAVIDSGVFVAFSRQATKSYLERPVMDDSFKQRKNKLTFQVIKLISKVLMPVLSFVPLTLMPIIDCKVRLKKD
jgi:SAM-dependent methyltransferase